MTLRSRPPDEQFAALLNRRIDGVRHFEPRIEGLPEARWHGEGYDALDFVEWAHGA
jgi:hypothetical protein